MILNCSLLCSYRLIFSLFACNRCFSSSNTTSTPLFLMKYFLSRILYLTFFLRSPFSYAQVDLCAYVSLSSKFEFFFPPRLFGISLSHLNRLKSNCFSYIDRTGFNQVVSSTQILRSYISQNSIHFINFFLENTSVNLFKTNKLFS